MNLCESCKKVGVCTWKGIPQVSPPHRLITGFGACNQCDCHDPITLADLAAKDAEIANLKDEVHSERAHWQDRIVRERNDTMDRAANGVLTAIAPLAERPCIEETHGAGFVLVGRVWHDENEVRKAAESLGFVDLKRGPTPDYTGEGSAWVPDSRAKGDAEGMAALLAREVVNLRGEVAKLKQATAVVVPVRGVVRDLHGEPMRGLSLQMYCRGWDDLASLLRAIPADRVLGEGMLSIHPDALTSVVETLREIGDTAHYASTGPEVPDVLWEIRGKAYEAYIVATSAEAEIVQAANALDALSALRVNQGGASA